MGVPPGPGAHHLACPGLRGQREKDLLRMGNGSCLARHLLSIIQWRTCGRRGDTRVSFG